MTPVAKVREQTVEYSTKEGVKRAAKKLSPKKTLLSLLKHMKDDVTYEDIMYELYVLKRFRTVLGLSRKEESFRMLRSDADSENG